jgi:phosphoesterase RecJ-like protein
MTHALVGLKELLYNSHRFLIIAHKSPDGDAVGSCAAIYFFLKNLGHNAKILLPDPPSKNLLPFLHGTDTSFHSEGPEEAQRRFEEADCLFCLDFNATSRVGAMQSLLESFAGTTVLIDHHTEPETFADILISDIHCSSTCQLLFESIEGMELTQHLDTHAARCLYLGIMTDTGSFRYPSVTKKTHQIISALIDCGIAPWQIHQDVFDHNSVDQLRLKGYAISEKLVLLNEGSTPFPAGYIFLTRQELHKFNYQSGDTEGLVNTILSIDGMKVGVLIQEKSDGIKMSFRSKDEIHVNTFARKHFHGGGHIYAAGGSSTDTLDVTIAKLVGLIPELFQN